MVGSCSSWTSNAAADTGSQLDHLGNEAAEPYAAIAIATEDHGPPVLEHQRVVALARLVREVIERAVVEDVAVLEDLDERRAAVGVRPPPAPPAGAWRRRPRCGRRRSRRRRAPAASGLKGRSTEPSGVDLVILPGSEVGEYCPLVSP